MRPKSTFTYGDIEIIVQKATFGDQLDGDWLVERLKAPITGFYRTFIGQVFTQTVSVSGLDIALPAKMDISEKALTEIYRTLREQDEGLMNAWFKALKEVDGPIGDVDMQSGEHIDPAKKKPDESGSS